MGLFWQDDEDFLLLYLGGGSVHTISQLQPLIFLEEITQTPIGHLFDMVTGDSAGSGPAAALTCPDKKGSTTPKISALQYYELCQDFIAQTFEPLRENYYANMVTLEIMIKGYEKSISLVEDWSRKKDKAINNTRLAKFFASKISATAEPLDLHKPESLTAKFNVFAALTSRTILPILQKRLDKAKDRVQEFFFSPDLIHKAFDEHLKFADGSPVMLHDTITGLHSESFNIDQREAEAHTNIKPMHGWKGHISHKNLPLSEIPKRSMPAQTVFKPYYSPVSKCYYDDIARHNTMAAPMNAIRRKFTKAQEGGLLRKNIKRIGLSIGCGINPPNIDPARMGELLLLGRLDAREGAPLLNIPQLFNTSKAIRDLEEELGEDNAIFIDKILDPALVLNPYRYRTQLEKYGETFGKNLIRGNLEEEAHRMPEHSLIDARPEKMAQLEEFGWAMVWENLDSLTTMAKKGLDRAWKKGHITDRQLHQRLKKIDEIFPPDSMKNPKSAPQNLTSYLSFGGRLPRFNLFTAKNAQDQPEDSRPYPH